MTNSGDRIPHADKVDPQDPARAHILITLKRMELAGVEIDDRAVEIAVHLGRWHQAQRARRDNVPEMRPGHDALNRKRWVYYVRSGHLIKIGTTADLANRLSAIRPNEILALEPGGQALEAERHRSFASLRVSGEYFHPGSALQEHIIHLRESLGPPNWHGSVVPDGQDWFAGPS
ncbi:GIY-YIG nuclease family protein [Streptomyces sp. NPDC006477]|uniref:GIY-YIG nuclease family protein n=1 Tax=Streptomyces sp. NPDC006477 TaxID=3364747 RepID=UPI0036B65CCA